MKRDLGEDIGDPRDEDVEPPTVVLDNASSSKLKVLQFASDVTSPVYTDVAVPELPEVSISGEEGSGELQSLISLETTISENVEAEEDIISNPRSIFTNILTLEKQALPKSIPTGYNRCMVKTTKLEPKKRANKKDLDTLEEVRLINMPADRWCFHYIDE